MVVVPDDIKKAVVVILTVSCILLSSQKTLLKSEVPDGQSHVPINWNELDLLFRTLFPAHEEQWAKEFPEQLLQV